MSNPIRIDTDHLTVMLERLTPEQVAEVMRLVVRVADIDRGKAKGFIADHYVRFLPDALRILAAESPELKGSGRYRHVEKLLGVVARKR